MDKLINNSEWISCDDTPKDICPAPGNVLGQVLYKNDTFIDAENQRLKRMVSFYWGNQGTDDGIIAYRAMPYVIMNLYVMDGASISTTNYRRVTSHP